MLRVWAQRRLLSEEVVRGGLWTATAPVKTAHIRSLRSDERRAGCACCGLDRRGRIDLPASQAELAYNRTIKIALDKQHGIFER